MKILSIGDNIIDIYSNLGKYYPGGNAFNVAMNASLLGARSTYMGCIATDSYGCHIKQVLNSQGIDLSLCHIPNASSTKLCYQNVIDGEREFLKVEVKDNYAGVPHLKDIDSRILESFDLIFTSVNAKVSDQLDALTKRTGILIFDFGEKEKYRTDEFFELVVPYIDIALFSMSGEDEHAVMKKMHLYQLTMPIIITRGSRPPLFYYRGIYVIGPTHHVRVIDTMGAGDAFVTAFMISFYKSGFQKNKPFHKQWVLQAFEEASLYSAQCCLKKGALDYEYPIEGAKAIIFDMDGVIVDSEKYWLALFNTIMKDHLLEDLNECERKELYGCSYKNEIEIISRRLNIDFDRAEVLRNAYVSHNPIHYENYIIDGINELITYLKEQRIALALASSSPLTDIKRMMESCHLSDMFDVILSGEMFQETKPHPDIYLQAIKELGIKKELIYVIEDSTYGVTAASRAHLKILALKHDGCDQDLSLATMSFDSHNNILNYIKYVLLKEE